MHVPWALWWGSLEGADLATLRREAAAAGFAAASATPAMVLTQSAGPSHGAAVVMIDPLLRGLPGACDAASVSARWRSTFEHDEDDCHRAADRTGASLINVAHFLGAPTPLEALVDAIGAITERAAARGRRVAIEAMPEGSIPDVATAAAIVDAVGHPACGLTVDTWHWWRSGGSLDELAALAPGSVFALQVSDALADARGTGTTPPSRDRLPVGEGDLPLGALLDWARRAHPAAHLGLEVFDRRHPGRSHADTARAAAVSVASLGGEGTSG